MNEKEDENIRQVLVHEIDSIKDKIHDIRGKQVILDRDIAELYGVSTSRLNEQVKRNIERFPEDFMFRLTGKEFTDLISHFATSRWGGIRKIPYAFTEQGVAGLSGVLRSKKAAEVHVKIMRAFLAMRKLFTTNGWLFNRIKDIDRKLFEHDHLFDRIFETIESKAKIPSKGIFFDGEIFDAYKLVSDIIRSANKSIILIDNYVDESVLTLFCKRRKNVTLRIYSANISKLQELDISKYNAQYPSIELIEFRKSHDRFLIIDKKEIYHMGASLKDLGKKWFAFSRIDDTNFGLIKRLS